MLRTFQVPLVYVCSTYQCIISSIKLYQSLKGLVSSIFAKIGYKGICRGPEFFFLLKPLISFICACGKIIMAKNRIIILNLLVSV